MNKKSILTILLMVLCITIVSAQAPPPPPPPPPGLPIDGGILFLFIASLVYGVKKLKD